MLIRIGKYEAALEEYEAHIKHLNPEMTDAIFSNAYDRKGSALMLLRRYDEAVQEYDVAIRFAPNNTDAICHKESALMQLGKREEAIRVYDRALQINPNILRAHRQRAHALYDLERYEEALTAYKKAQQRDPDGADYIGVIREIERKIAEKKKAEQGAKQDNQPRKQEAKQKQGVASSDQHVRPLAEPLISRRKAILNLIGAGAVIALVEGGIVELVARSNALENLSSDPEWYLHPVDTKMVNIKAEQEYDYPLPKNYIASETIYNSGENDFRLNLTVNNSSNDLEIKESSLIDETGKIEIYAPNGSAIKSWEKLVEQKEKEFNAKYPGQTLYIIVLDTNPVNKDGSLNIIFTGYYQ